jgi:hypothetical protein
LAPTMQRDIRNISRLVRQIVMEDVHLMEDKGIEPSLAAVLINCKGLFSRSTNFMKAVKFGL